MKGCTLYRGHARFESANTVRVGDDLLTRRQDLPQCRRPRRGAGPARHRRHRLSDQHLDDGARRRCRAISSSSAAAISALEFAQMFRRFGAEVTVIEKGAAPDRPRGRGHLGRDPGDPRGRGHRGPAQRRLHRLRQPRRRHRRRRRLRHGEPPAVGSHVLLGGRPHAQHRRSRPRQGRRRGRQARLSSSSTTSCTPTCPASGRWATATARAPSPTPPTTTSRSSPPTCSTTTRARSATASTAYALYIDPPLGRVGMTEAAARKSGRTRPGRPAADDPRRPRRRKGRDARLHEDPGRCRDQGNPRRRDPRPRRRRGGALRARPDVCQARRSTTLQRAVHIHPTVSELLPTIAQELKPLG